jgi:predicted RNA-binding protein YlqC (UPF0109 family)
VTDLYEAGDINQSEANDDDVDDVDDDIDDIDDEDIDDEVGAGNELGDEDGGTALAVLTYLARSLSNDPDSVVIDTEERRGGLRLNLHVAPDDMGRVIGRRGRTAQAIRTLVNVAGAKDGVQASVDIVDD